jgi:hypothetical protein
VRGRPIGHRALAEQIEKEMSAIEKEMSAHKGSRLLRFVRS